MTALAALTWMTVLRFLRESRVVRSVVWPAFLGPMTLSLTLLLAALWTAPETVVAVPTDLSPALARALEADGLLLTRVDDPQAAVAEGLLNLGTDGATVWTSAYPESTLRLENVLRAERGAAWRMEPQRILLPHPHVRRVGGNALRPMGVLFVLYAMVFAMGSVARDHDEAILDAERSLPMPTWVAGLARWNATVLVLGASWALTIGLMVAMMDSEAPVEHFLRGLGAVAAAGAIGLALIGGGGIRRGFSAAFAGGAVLVMGPISAGVAVPGGGWLPLFSLFTDGPGWSSALLGLLMGPVAALLFGWRVRRAA